jgi:mono/diheme cytochrome c family protein
MNLQAKIAAASFVVLTAALALSSAIGAAGGAPKATPNAPPKATPSAPPKATPSAPPKATPNAPPKATPNAPPKTTPNAPPNPLPNAADVEAGKPVYVDQCQSCHGDRGQGNPRAYKKVGAKVVDLGSKEAQDKSDQSIRDTIVNGVGKMEKCDEVTVDQLDKIVAFVRSLRLPEPKK